MKEQVAIIYSPGFGAGWSTWGCPEMALDQELAKAIETGGNHEVYRVASENWPDGYKGGLLDCVVRWVDKGTLFEIREYDGSESLHILEEHNPYIAATPWVKQEGETK